MTSSPWHLFPTWLHSKGAPWGPSRSPQGLLGASPMEVPLTSKHSGAVNNIPRAWGLPEEGGPQILQAPRSLQPPFLSIIHDFSPYEAGKALTRSFSFHLSASVSLRLLASGRDHLAGRDLLPFRDTAQSGTLTIHKAFSEP